MNYNTKELEGQLKDSPYVWVGCTSNPIEYVAVLYTAVAQGTGKYEPCIVSDNGVEVVVTVKSSDYSKNFANKVVEILRLCTPSIFTGEHPISVHETQTLPRLQIISDLNTEMVSKGFMVLPYASIVIPLQASMDVSGYKYTITSVSDGCNIECLSMPTGDDNTTFTDIPQVLTDTSAFADVVIDDVIADDLDLFLSTPDIRAFMVYGNKGVGKTVACKAYCEQHKIPYVQITCDKSMEKNDLLFDIQPNTAYKIGDTTYKAEDVGSDFIAVVQAIAAAANKPCVIALDEFTFLLRKDFFHQLFDDSAKFELPNGDVVTLDANCKFFLTSNYPTAAYAGVTELNSALEDRLIVRDLDDLSVGELCNRVEADTHLHNPQFLHSLVEYCFELNERFQIEGFDDCEIATRRLNAFCKLLQVGYAKGYSVEKRMAHAVPLALIDHVAGHYKDVKTDKAFLRKLRNDAIKHLTEEYNKSLGVASKAKPFSIDLDITANIEDLEGGIGDGEDL